MSLDVSVKHSEYMFRLEILKLIIIEGGSPILAHLVDGIIRCRGIYSKVFIRINERIKVLNIFWGMKILWIYFLAITKLDYI